jgi:hypothetical protein
VAAAVADEELQIWNYGGGSDPSHISNRQGYHPGTRVVVDATPRLGRRSRPSKAVTALSNRLVAGLRNRGYWVFRNCFENATRLRSDPGGKTFLRVTVAATGQVVASHLLRSTVREKAVGQCVAVAILSLRTDRPLGRAVEADVTVSTWPGDLPLLPLPADSDKSTKLAEFDSAAAAQFDTFSACFASARTRDRGLWGRLALGFSLNSLGQPVEIRETQSHFGNAETTACVAKALAMLNLPPQPPGARFEVALRLDRPKEDASTEQKDSPTAPAPPAATTVSPANDVTEPQE